MELIYSIPDDPKQSKNANLTLKVDDIILEQCSDVIVSLTHLVPDFKTMLRYDDLFSKPGNLDLEKKLRFQAPLYYIRKQFVK